MVPTTAGTGLCRGFFPSVSIVDAGCSSEFDEHFPNILPPEQAEERIGCGFYTVVDRFTYGHGATCDQAAHVRIEFLHAVDELVGVDKALHADACRNRADQIFHLLRFSVVVDVDHPANGEAREVIGDRERGIQMLAPDIVEINVDAGFAERLERFRKLG